MKPMLAKTYKPGQDDIRGWLISEKLDGVRAIWTGVELVSRNGNTFAAPPWFTKQLPPGLKLDGELFLDRGRFQTTAGIVRKKQPIDTEWRQLTYMVFDAPEAKGGFELRLETCRQALAGCAVAKIVEHRICRDETHLQEIFLGLVAAGAEGVMLRRPGSVYEQRRSSSLLKLKPKESDEAEVIAHQAGTGKFSGQMGALVCKWRGVVFRLGTGFSDWTRFDPPAVGSRVTFGFQGVTNGGVPRFPVFIAARDYE